jgi:cytochrome P450
MLQGDIIMAVTCGEEHVDKKCQYEQETGEIIESPVFEIVSNLENDANNAVLGPMAFIAPELGAMNTGPMKRLDKNLKRLRDFISTLCENSKSKYSVSELEKQGSLISILLTDDLYKENNLAIANEIITFFFAGTQTVALSSANAMMYLNQSKHKDYKTKFMNEVESIMKDKKDVIAEYSLDDCDNLKFVKEFYNETLRHDTIAPLVSFVQITEDTTIDGIRFTPDDMEMSFML